MNRCRTDRTQVLRKSKYWIRIPDGPIVCVYGVVKRAIGRELLSCGYICSACAVSQGCRGQGRIVPVAVFCLLVDLCKRQLFLSEKLVICNVTVTRCNIIRPLSSSIPVARDPFLIGCQRNSQIGGKQSTDSPADISVYNCTSC